MEDLKSLAAALRPQERRFVQEYLADLNGTRAAIRAGYSERTAASQASRLMRKPEVKQYRDALLQEQFDAIGVTRHSLASRVYEVYERCMQKKAVLEWDSAAKEWLESGEWEFDARGALKALGMLSDMLDKLEPDEGDEDELEHMLAGGRGF